MIRLAILILALFLGCYHRTGDAAYSLGTAAVGVICSLVGYACCAWDINQMPPKYNVDD